MTPSLACIDLVKSFEQCRLTAYMPTPNDRPTIGWGTTGPDVHLGMAWTQEHADERFAHDLAQFAAGVAHLAPICSQGQFDAMVSLSYNIGMANFASSTVLRDHLAGDHAGAAAAFAMWNKQHHVVLNGLTRRRAAEAALYRS